MLKRIPILSGLSVLLTAACFNGGSPDSAAYRVKASDLSEEDAKSVRFVKSVAGDFADPAAARAAGYTVQYPEGCIKGEAGSQGIHFSNPSLLDGYVQMNRPEVLMFEPQADGSMVLVGVDYVVPFERWKNKEPPQLIGRAFVRNEEIQAWMLHVWTHRSNPDGVFAMYNPNVTCNSPTGARPASAQSP